MQRSRLTKKIEQQSKKNLFLSILGIVAILFLVIKFGIPLLVNFSFFISGANNSQEQAQNDKETFIASPVLNPLPQATSSAKITISGVSSPNQTIELYINDNLINKAQTEKDGKFSFQETITKGENTVKTKAVEDNKESNFSRSITITLRNASPSLNIKFPSDGQSFSKDQNILEIQGTTDQDVKVTINDFWAITDIYGNFSYRLPLQNGENTIKFLAVDPAGNKSEKEIKVTYSP